MQIMYRLGCFTSWQCLPNIYGVLSLALEENLHLMYLLTPWNLKLFYILFCSVFLFVIFTYIVALILKIQQEMMNMFSPGPLFTEISLPGV